MGSGIRSARRYRNHTFFSARPRGLVLALLCCVLGLGMLNAPALAATPASGGGGNQPNLVISAPNPASGPAGMNVVVSGAHWHQGELVTLVIGSADGGCNNPTTIPGTNSGTPDGTGAVEIVIVWPTTLGTGTYPLCGSSQTISTVKTSNSFVELSQSAASLSLPSSAASGATVQVTGANWFPAGRMVELHWGAAGSNGCTTLLTTLTAQSDGSLSGSIQIPSFTSNTDIVIAATSPANTCGQQNPPPGITMTATVAVTGTGPSATPTPSAATATPVPPGTATPTKATPTPARGSATPTPGPRPSPTATPTGGSGGGGGSGPCPPLPNSFCGSNSSFPWWLLCLMLLGLFLLFIILLLVLISRRNQQVLTQEEDITSQINPNSVAPMGSMRFVRAVRVTTQVVDRRTGQIINSRSRDYDEFADSNGNTQRRPRA